MSKRYATFVCESNFHCTVEELFDFHESKSGFETLVSLDPNVKVIQPPENILMGAEAIMEVEILPFIKKRWIATHTGYKKNEFFEDTQVLGPFKYFRHRHIFLPAGNHCILRDQIEFDFLLLNISKHFIFQKLKSQFLKRHLATANFLNVSWENILTDLE